MCVELSKLIRDHITRAFLQVLIFSQFTKVLDIMDYYFSEKNIEVCRIDGRVRLDERKKQVLV